MVSISNILKFSIVEIVLLILFAYITHYKIFCEFQLGFCFKFIQVKFFFLVLYIFSGLVLKLICIFSISVPSYQVKPTLNRVEIVFDELL